MLKYHNLFMDSKIAIFSILALAAIFAMALPMDTAVAQTSDVYPDGEGEDGEHEGKSCPFKNKKTSVDVNLDI